jgi:hypothetical protein
VFIVGPDKKIKLMLSYPMSTGRNFDEVMRVLDSMQLTAKHKVATPWNWKNGDDVIILPVVTDEEAKQKYPNGWKAPKPYLRIVPQPKVRLERIEAARCSKFVAFAKNTQRLESFFFDEQLSPDERCSLRRLSVLRKACHLARGADQLVSLVQP